LAVMIPVGVGQKRNGKNAIIPLQPAIKKSFARLYQTRDERSILYFVIC